MSSQAPVAAPGPAFEVPGLLVNLNSPIVPTLLQPTHLVTVDLGAF